MIAVTTHIDGHDNLGYLISVLYKGLTGHPGLPAEVLAKIECLIVSLSFQQIGSVRDSVIFALGELVALDSSNRSSFRQDLLCR